MKVTSIRRRPYTERFLHNGFNVFVESNATALIDKFFSDNKIYALDFKSKTWSRMCRVVTKMNIDEMRKLWGSKPQITFSHYAGCSMCPCSPGYRVRKAFGPQYSEFQNSDVWVKIKVDLKALTASLPTYKKLLDEEIAQHNGLAAIA